MSELEKAARTLIELAQLENPEVGVPGYWCPEETVLTLRAALEAEAGWETALLSEPMDAGYTYRWQRRPLREDGDDA